MKAITAFFVLNIFVSVTAQSASGDVRGETGSESVTVDPNQILVPTINWSDILKNVPTIPPLVLPTLDPNFWQQLFTMPPIAIPTIDTDFWKYIPTIPPIAIPTIDTDFWKYIPTIPPLQLPTLDANFWQNLNFPTPSPLQIPTLDSNFWQKLATLAPLPTFSAFVFPTPTPKTALCTYKLSQEIQNNQTFSSRMNYTNVQQVLHSLLSESKRICTGLQVQKLIDLSKKHQSLINDMQEISPYLSTSDFQKIFLSILQGDFGTVLQLLFSKTMENLADPTGTGKLSKCSSQISLLQFDLAINPV